MAKSKTNFSKTNSSKTETDFSKTNFDPSVNAFMELPSAVREAAERGLNQARDAFQKLKTAVDETSEAAGNTYALASKGTVALGDRFLDAARNHMDASFDHMTALFGAKSFADALELQTAFVRERTEAVTKTSKDMAQLAQKVFSDVSEPARAGLEKVIRFPG